MKAGVEGARPGIDQAAVGRVPQRDLERLDHLTGIDVAVGDAGDARGPRMVGRRQEPKLSIVHELDVLLRVIFFRLVNREGGEPDPFVRKVVDWIYRDLGIDFG